MEFTQSDTDEMDKFTKQMKGNYAIVRKDHGKFDDGGIGYLIQAINDYGDTDSDFVNHFKDVMLHDASIE